MRDTIYSLDEIKNVVAPIAIKYDVERIFLFGSYARGEARGDSDIDFIIDKGRIRGLQFAGMLGDLQDNFDKSIDLLTISGIADDEGEFGFKQRIEKEMVLVYAH